MEKVNGQAVARVDHGSRGLKAAKRSAESDLRHGIEKGQQERISLPGLAQAEALPEQPQAGRRIAGLAGEKN
jgi:hypothetical protein